MDKEKTWHRVLYKEAVPALQQLSGKKTQHVFGRLQKGKGARYPNDQPNDPTILKTELEDIQIIEEL